MLPVITCCNYKPRHQLLTLFAMDYVYCSPQGSHRAFLHYDTYCMYAKMQYSCSIFITDYILLFMVCGHIDMHSYNYRVLLMNVNKTNSVNFWLYDSALRIFLMCWGVFLSLPIPSHIINSCTQRLQMSSFIALWDLPNYHMQKCQSLQIYLICCVFIV